MCGSPSERPSLTPQATFMRYLLSGFTDGGDTCYHQTCYQSRLSQEKSDLCKQDKIAKVSTFPMVVVQRHPVHPLKCGDAELVPKAGVGCVCMQTKSCIHRSIL